ncbi:MAG: ATP-binding protein, partial [Candidatus Binatia bacterium]
RTLLVVNYRPEYRAPWLDKPYCREIPLQPLGPSEIEELLADLLGRDESLGGVAGRIQERTGGNPFFIEEAVQSLVEAGSLEGKRGAYRLVRPIADLAIPATVQAALAARIDRLAESSKRLLQTAAVIGKEFAGPILKRVAGLGDADLDASLGILLEGDFLHEQALFPETVYAFKHPLTQEVAYQSQLSEHRARVHAAVAQAIADLYPERLEPLAALLAHHYEKAGEPLPAAQWSFQAAQWAGKGNMTEGLHHWRKARELLDQAPQTPETMLSGALARSAMISLCTRLGDHANDVDRLYAEGKQLVDRIADKRAQALLEGAYAAALSSGGVAARALEHSLEAKRLAEEAGDPEVRLSLWVPIIYAHEVAGRLREALAFVEEALAHPPEDPRLGVGILGFSPYIWLVYFRAMFLMSFGRLEEAGAQLDRAAELAREHGEQEVLGLTYGCYSILAHSIGDPEIARRHSRVAVEIAEKIGSPLSRALAYNGLGIAHLMDREWRESIAAHERSLAIARENRTAVWAEGYTLANLAEAHLGLGNGDLALEFAENAVARTRVNEVKAVEGYAQLSLARVLLRTRGRAAKPEIESALEAVGRVAERTGEVRYLPLVLLERAEIAALEGDPALAERARREAHRLFTEMGATGFADDLARTLGLEEAIRPPATDLAREAP